MHGSRRSRKVQPTEISLILSKLFWLAIYTTTSDEKYFNEAIKLYEDFIETSSSVEVGALNNLAFLLADKTMDIDKAVKLCKKGL